MAKKKITNSANKKVCATRQHTPKSGKKGQITGSYKAKKSASSYVKKNFGDVIKKLSNE